MCPLIDSIATPISVRGSIIRLMGRLASESSPVNSAVIRLPANNPANSRRVVPELPQLRGLSGLENTPPFIRTVFPDFTLWIPHSARHFRVDSTSSPVDILCITHSPSVREANISALWEMDLSPGRLISPLILIIFNLFVQLTNCFNQSVYHFIGIRIIFLQVPK